MLHSLVTCAKASAQAANKQLSETAEITEAVTDQPAAEDGTLKLLCMLQLVSPCS